MKNHISKFLRLIFDSNYRFLIKSLYGLTDSIPDKEYLSKMFEIKMGYPIDFNNVKTYNEKLQWLKLYNRNPLYTILVDKFKVREYITQKLGEEYLIPLLGVWDRPEEINFGNLPNNFVLKCNHNSGTGMCICKDKSKLDLVKTRKELQKGLNEDYYKTWREWPYKDVPRKIVAEKYIQDKNGELIDYKFFCFDGFAYCVMACLDRQSGHPKFAFFDKNWNQMHMMKVEDVSDVKVPAPSTLKQMFSIAEKLSVGLPCVRVDLFSCDDKIYFGELTFFSDAGFDNSFLPEADAYLGSLIDLSKITK